MHGSDKADECSMFREWLMILGELHVGMKVQGAAGRWSGKGGPCVKKGRVLTLNGRKLVNKFKQGKGLMQLV